MSTSISISNGFSQDIAPDDVVDVVVIDSVIVNIVLFSPMVVGAALSSLMREGCSCNSVWCDD